MRAVDLQIIAPEWPAPPGVRAAFTLRTGGVSLAPYDSLNLGARIGDSPEAVAENRRRVREKLRLPAEPVWLEQVHGVQVVELGAAGKVVRAAGHTGPAGRQGALADAGVGAAGRQGAVVDAGVDAVADDRATWRSRRSPDCMDGSGNRAGTL